MQTSEKLTPWILTCAFPPGVPITCSQCYCLRTLPPLWSRYRSSSHMRSHEDHHCSVELITSTGWNRKSFPTSLTDFKTKNTFKPQLLCTSSSSVMWYRGHSQELCRSASPVALPDHTGFSLRKRYPTAISYLSSHLCGGWYPTGLVSTHL